LKGKDFRRLVRQGGSSNPKGGANRKKSSEFSEVLVAAEE
jgi:hypothetical protein